jgi:cyclopropane-fatty-acyl-phospholipid synthase
MSVISMFSSVLEPGNTPDQSKLNVAKHYDLSNNIFAAFLSPDMTYSCPLWLPPHDPGHSSDTLERAQERKYAYHIKAARIQSTDHVLEIGTGWGSFAIQVVRETGCTVTSITPSREQKALAEERIAAACLTDKITIILSDYREVPQLGIQYDKLVSIEMIEHIGLEYLEGYFAIINELLKKTGGVATFQCTLMAESVSHEPP